MKFRLIIDRNKPYLHKTCDEPIFSVIAITILLKFIVFLKLLTLLAGCVSTIVPSPLHLNPEQKAEDTEGPTYSFVGHQYLLFFPFGQVYVDGPLQVLQDFMNLKYAGAPAPQVISASLRLSAYDLFFTRYVVCTLTARARCRGYGEPTLYSSARYTEYSRYGFENDLSRVWYRCLKEAEAQLCSSF